MSGFKHQRHNWQSLWSQLSMKNDYDPACLAWVHYWSNDCWITPNHRSASKSCTFGFWNGLCRNSRRVWQVWQCEHHLKGTQYRFLPLLAIHHLCHESMCQVHKFTRDWSMPWWDNASRVGEYWQDVGAYFHRCEECWTSVWPYSHNCTSICSAHRKKTYLDCWLSTNKTINKRTVKFADWW